MAAKRASKTAKPKRVFGQRQEPQNMFAPRSDTLEFGSFQSELFEAVFVTTHDPSHTAGG
jgi:hypothetical protein